MGKLVASLLVAVVCATASSSELTAEQSAVLEQVRSACNKADPSGTLADAKVKEVTRLMTATVASRGVGSIVFLVPSNLGTQPTFTAGDTVQVAFVYSGVASVDLFLSTDLVNSIGTFSTQNTSAYGVQTLTPTLTTAGTYTFRLVGGGVTVDSDPFVVKTAGSAVAPLLVAIGGPTTGVTGQIITIKPAVVGGTGPFTSVWTGATANNDGTASVTLGSGSSQAVKLEVSSTADGKKSDTLTISVTTPQTPSAPTVSLSVDGVVVPAGQPLTLSAGTHPAVVTATANGQTATENVSLVVAAAPAPTPAPAITELNLSGWPTVSVSYTGNPKVVAVADGTPIAENANSSSGLAVFTLPATVKDLKFNLDGVTVLDIAPSSTTIPQDGLVVYIHNKWVPNRGLCEHHDILASNGEFYIKNDAKIKESLNRLPLNIERTDPLPSFLGPHWLRLNGSAGIVAAYPYHLPDPPQPVPWWPKK